jgi:hypothetical protein
LTTKFAGQQILRISLMTTVFRVILQLVDTRAGSSSIVKHQCVHGRLGQRSHDL